MSKVTDAGKICPQCGAHGRYNGEHETAVRNFEVGRVKPELIKRNIVDVGWRCWNCGHEWGFELEKQEQKPVFVTEDKAIHQGAILSGTDKEILESAKTGEGMITIESVEQLQEMAKAAAERFEEFKELCRPMELWQARIVRILRVEKNSSWRAVAEVCYKLGPFFFTPQLLKVSYRRQTRLWGWHYARGQRSS